MYNLKIRAELDSKFEKLAKKNIKQLEIILNKADEIIQDPHRYKNLRAPMNHLKRVHIDKHFVLVFSVDEEAKTVTLEDYDHHDNIY
ncbi:type II toxin-antitoxin system RelE family toxin [Methanosarcina sp.]|uniref:type II toxin-antitoxin system RelE family toxin n=1 Tax=Methanosarcina sp. TaxID=2213 RepID=UPI003BB6FFEA